MALRLTKQQRDEIQYLRDHQHYSRRDIEDIMWKDHSVLLREYNRNKKRWWVYDPKLAQQKTYLRNRNKKKQCKIIRMCNSLEDYVLEKLEIWRSPECVAGRWNDVERAIYQLKYKYLLPLTSWSSIRRYIHSRYGYRIKDHMIWHGKLKKNRRKPKREKRTWGKIKHRIFIDKRPLIVSKPATIGHFECDFIESIRWDKTVFLTLVDKFSRLKIAIKLPNKESKLVLKTLKYLIKKYDIKSITFDNDNGFALHYLLWIPTYFCHTYSSREKGQIEEWNGEYRDFFSKKTEFKNITQEEIDQVTDYLNNKPFKCLKYYTPNEIWEQEIVKQKTIYLADK